ncbi:hypothetical protein SNA_16435 [Streptomyces natalensis ATCC 27448]|uniref:Uncharacterized protein n=1 Tax=Streptomyces natalensis ATCC 27448 TaxID=1240678 RepID=A0A0D7CK69_9ACTN|nr:hypothetical protein SNA_16435 [Streptomyces natalensis ATCC 27448]
MTKLPRRVNRTQRKRSAQLLENCQQQLASLRLPGAFDTRMLCEHIGRQRGHPIHLIPMVMQASDPCGLWIATNDADYIIYEANTSKLHQEHIIAHELAHMICCHRGTGELDKASMNQLFPDLNPELLRDIFGRTTYSDRQEEEAEIMASLILERANRRPPGTTWKVPPEAAETVARIERSLKNSPTSTS